MTEQERHRLIKEQLDRIKTGQTVQRCVVVPVFEGEITKRTEAVPDLIRFDHWGDKPNRIEEYMAPEEGYVRHVKVVGRGPWLASSSMVYDGMLGIGGAATGEASIVRKAWIGGEQYRVIDWHIWMHSYTIVRDRPLWQLHLLALRWRRQRQLLKECVIVSLGIWGLADYKLSERRPEWGDILLVRRLMRKGGKR